MDEATPLGPDPAPFTRLPDILRSWFWRYYDHLGHLILYNLLWFLGLWALIGAVKNQPLITWTYLLFLPACAYSLPWAYLTFRVFVAGSGSLKELPGAFRRFALKGLALALLSIVVFGIGALNLSICAKWQGGMHYPGLLLIGVTLWILLFWTGVSIYPWPLLFFQNPPFRKILYRSFLLFLDNIWTDLFLLLMGAGMAFLFTFVLKLLPWAFFGPVFFFSLQCVALEKHLMRYKITHEDEPLGDILGRLEKERRRSWREFFRPWEAK